MDDPGYYQDLLRPLFRDQRLVVCGVVAAGMTPVASMLRKLGAQPCLLIALSRGTGDLPVEDKILIDAFWDTVDIRRAPSEIVPVDREALKSAMRRLDRGLGTVCAGDARDGVHGGAHRLRWVRQPEDLPEAERFFAQHCDRVRVMPFLEGIPCSIHGIAFDDAVVAVRPVEMVNLHIPKAPGVRYCGAATFWDPPDQDREYMRALARRVGAALRERIHFRGPFTIDGVLAEESFLPTELNPRFGAGLVPIGKAVSELPLIFLLQALVANEPLDYRPADLEGLLVDRADAARGGAGFAVLDTPMDRTREHPLVLGKDAARLASEGETSDGMLALGPSAVGGFVRFTPEPARTPRGPSIAGRVIAAFALADREFGAGIGPVSPARAVR